MKTAGETSAEETMFRLALLDLGDAVDVELWWSAGFDDPNEVRELVRRRRLKNEDLGRFVAWGITNASEIRRHLKARITADAVEFFASEGIVDPVEQRRLAREGMTASRIHGYERAGFNRWSDVVRLAAAKVPSDLPTYAQFTDATVDDLVEMTRLGIDWPHLFGFKQAGITGAAEILALTRGGLTGIEVGLFAGGGVTDVETIEVLRRHGVSGEAARRYAMGGVGEWSDMVRLSAAGVDAAAAEAFGRVDIDSADEMIEALRAGLTQRRANAYRKAGIRGSGVWALLEAGITGQRAGRYRKAGVDTVAEMVERWFNGDRP